MGGKHSITFAKGIENRNLDLRKVGANSLILRGGVTLKNAEWGTDRKLRICTIQNLKTKKNKPPKKGELPEKDKPQEKSKIVVPPTFNIPSADVNFVSSSSKSIVGMVFLTSLDNVVSIECDLASENPKDIESIEFNCEFHL